MHVTKSKTVISILAVSLIGIVGFWAAAVPESAAQTAPSTSRLVSVQDFPQMEACTWQEPAASSASRAAALSGEDLLGALELRGGTSFLMASLEQPASVMAAPPQQGQGMLQGGRGLPSEFDALRQGTSTHVRTLADTYPTFTAVGVNFRTNEVILQDNNLWSAYIFNRQENTPPRARFSEPKRIIAGPRVKPILS